MSREQFLKRLEELLYDISPEERREALEYYRGYFEDAGVENEAAIMQELESPEKVAQTIRAGISGDDASGIYTERGFQESDAPVNAPMVRLQKENQQRQENKSGPYQTNWKQENQQSAQRKATDFGYENRDNMKKIGILVLLLLTCPLWISLFGCVLGVLASIFAVAVVAVVLSIVFIISGGALLGTAVATFASGALAEGMAMAGAACLLWAIALLGIVAVVWFFGRVVPWFVRLCVDMTHALFFGKKERCV